MTGAALQDRGQLMVRDSQRRAGRVQRYLIKSDWHDWDDTRRWRRWGGLLAVRPVLTPSGKQGWRFGPGWSARPLAVCGRRSSLPGVHVMLLPLPGRAPSR